MKKVTGKKKTIRKDLLFPSSTDKGQATLIGHAVLVGISVFLVLVVVITFNNIRKDYQDFIATNELEQSCYALKSSMEKVYNDADYLSPTNTTYGKVRIVLPEKAADLKYRTKIENKTLYLETLTPPLINISCKVGLNASYSGFTTGGVTEISYNEYSNGTRQILLEKVG